MSTRFGFTGGQPRRVEFEDHKIWISWVCEQSDCNEIIGLGIVDAWWQFRSYTDPTRGHYSAERRYLGDKQRLDIVLEQLDRRLVVFHPGGSVLDPSRCEVVYYAPGTFQV